MPAAETIGLGRDVSSSRGDANNGHPIQNETSFAEILSGISALVACLRPDGAVETVNHHVLDYFGKDARGTRGVVEHRRRSPG